MAGVIKAAFGLVVVATTGLAGTGSANSFDAAYNDGVYHGGPYYVAGFGDDHSRGGRPYWGGPYFVSCPGNNPSFETHRPPYPGCRSFAKIAVLHRRTVKVHLK